MFTGIIQKMGKIIDSKDAGSKRGLVIEQEFSDLVLGESIAVNGVCLTVSSCTDNTFSADLLMETIKNTNLFFCKKGDPVNLERALAPTDRLGGHFVTGHVDEVGGVVSVTKGKEIILKIKIKKENAKYLAQKGSVALNGISFTVVAVGRDYFTVHLIPHTLDQTNLKDMREKEKVNVEYDILSKYVEKHLGVLQSSKVTRSYLKQHGY